jgi:CheY-like chemotaxis protein
VPRFPHVLMDIRMPVLDGLEAQLVILAYEPGLVTPGAH